MYRSAGPCMHGPVRAAHVRPAHSAHAPSGTASLSENANSEVFPYTARLSGSHACGMIVGWGASFDDRSSEPMILATSYPFLEVFWTMLIFFAFVVWLWILFTVLADIFRRHDTSGFMKVIWIIFIIVLPYFGVFIYLIAEHKGMTERAIKQQQAAQAQIDDYVKSVAGPGDPTEQIAKGKQLLDSGTITQAEFDQIKQKALAS